MENKTPVLLSVRDICKTYSGFRLEKMSFDLREGTITGFIGRNGAGKTTAINTILSFVHRDGGTVLFRGQSLSDRDREKIGFVSAGMTFYMQKSLRTITGVTRSFYPSWDDAAYGRYMQSFGLPEDRKPAQLSNGMRIRYALVLALSHGAELLILDEPSSGLDPVSREEMTEIFLDLKDAGKTILFSTHIISDLEKCADRILFIRRGQLKADEPMTAFCGGYRIAEITGDIPQAMRAVCAGACRTREGYTVLVPAEEGGRFAAREATMEEIMVHLEKGAEEI